MYTVMQNIVFIDVKFQRQSLSLILLPSTLTS
jgi:hypothetical protein